MNAQLENEKLYKIEHIWFYDMDGSILRKRRLCSMKRGGWRVEICLHNMARDFFKNIFSRLE